MLLALFLSFVCTNLTNPFILYNQRLSREKSISLHAAQKKSAHILYFLGHLFGGIFFLIFAYKFFYQQLDSNLLWALAIGGTLSEWTQALIPARGKFNKYHKIFAWSMALFISAIIIAAPLVYGLGGNGTIAFVASVGTLLVCTIVGLFVGVHRFWIPQIIYFFMFYIIMVILIS